MASTIKLAMTVDLLLRDRAGTVTLSAEDREHIRSMLRSSNDKAANTLWDRFDGAVAAHHYSKYGLSGLVFPRVRRWGSAQCTADDLDRLIGFVLDRLPPELRSYVVGHMRTVAPNQQWGVWGAGAAAAPGNKNGWWGYSTGWVINSVGFVGPGERYTVALMNDLQGAGGYDDGVRTTTRVGELLFSGRF
jgi:hypothetical protein